jgi:hypothetical protein
LDNAHRDAGSLNAVITEGTTNILVLHPGIYTSIQITGGNVRFTPGIYVLRPNNNTSDTLVITGTNTVVDGRGIMFYNTGSNYVAADGSPDNGDPYLTSPPPPPDGAHFGGVTINTGVDVVLKPLDTANGTYDYSETTAATTIEPLFNGMLFYQRRMNDERIQIEGNSANLVIEGNFYAKWAPLSMAGQSTMNASFVVGAMDMEANASVTIAPQGNVGPQAQNVFLVE